VKKCRTGGVGSPTPLLRARVTRSRFPRTVSSWGLSISRRECSTTSLGNLLPCNDYPCNKKYFPHVETNFLCSKLVSVAFCPFSGYHREESEGFLCSSIPIFTHIGKTPWGLLFSRLSNHSHAPLLDSFLYVPVSLVLSSPAPDPPLLMCLTSTPTRLEEQHHFSQPAVITIVLFQLDHNQEGKRFFLLLCNDTDNFTALS